MQWSGPSAVFTSLKTHKFLFVGGLLIIALPIGYTASNGSKASRFIAAALADPLAVLEGRSPGVRASGALAQSKPKKKLPTGLAKPSERVLANVRSRPTVPAAVPESGAQSPLTAMPGLFDATPATESVLGSTTDSPTVSNPGSVGGGLLPITPGLIAGGGTPATGPTADIPTPVPVTPVPEPQTWLMMLIGFMMMGKALRSRPRVCVEENGLERNV